MKYKVLCCILLYLLQHVLLILCLFSVKQCFSFNSMKFYPLNFCDSLHCMLLVLPLLGRTFSFVEVDLSLE